MDSFSGSLEMHTFKKLPTARPRIKMKNEVIINICIKPYYPLINSPVFPDFLTIKQKNYIVGRGTSQARPSWESEIFYAA